MRRTEAEYQPAPNDNRRSSNPSRVMRPPKGNMRSGSSNMAKKVARNLNCASCNRFSGAWGDDLATPQGTSPLVRLAPTESPLGDSTGPHLTPPNSAATYRALTNAQDPRQPPQRRALIRVLRDDQRRMHVQRDGRRPKSHVQKAHPAPRPLGSLPAPSLSSACPKFPE